MFGRRVQKTDTGWLTVLEKNGLCLESDIFENYGIDSETDLFVLNQDDFSKLPSRGLKPLHVKKLDLWCDTVRERVENMLTSSLNAPSAAAVLSSKTLNVVTPTTHSVNATEFIRSDRSVGQKGQDHSLLLELFEKMTEQTSHFLKEFKKQCPTCLVTSDTRKSLSGVASDIKETEGMVRKSSSVIRRRNTFL